jgi:hypothetical protein
MLSFTVIHDTVINMVQVDKHTTVVHHTDKKIHLQACEIDTVDDIHAMFHFVALITGYKSSFVQLPTKKLLSHNPFTYTFTYKETSYKPPKA